MPKDNEFSHKIFLHTLDRLRSFVPIIEMGHTKFSQDGNNILEAVLKPGNMEEWDLKILLTRRP